MEGAGARSFCRGTREKGLNWFYFRRLFRRNKAVESSVLNELKLTTGETLTRKAVKDKVTRKAVSDRVTRIDVERHDAIARLHREVKY